MERCYVCEHCGRCDEFDLAIAPPAPACLDCGHVVQPGESPAFCAACGSARIAKPNGAHCCGGASAKPHADHY